MYNYGKVNLQMINQDKPSAIPQWAQTTIVLILAAYFIFGMCACSTFHKPGSFTWTGTTGRDIMLANANKRAAPNMDKKWLNYREIDHQKIIIFVP